jgi:hypothetical protein
MWIRDRKPKKKRANVERFRKIVRIELPKIARDHLCELADDAGKSRVQFLEEMIWDKWMTYELRRKRLEREAAERTAAELLAKRTEV